MDALRAICAAGDLAGGAQGRLYFDQYFLILTFKVAAFKKSLMATKITRPDPRYATLHRSRNLRWDANEAKWPAEIEMCSSAEQAAETLQRVVKAGMRPTIRSGGHCYEDFVVNNPGGAILDLSVFKTDQLPKDGERHRVSPGQQLGEVYIDLFKRRGVTIP